LWSSSVALGRKGLVSQSSQGNSLPRVSILYSLITLPVYAEQTSYRQRRKTNRKNCKNYAISHFQIITNNNNNNNNNSIYLRANLTAQRPITKRERVEKKHTYKQKQKQGNSNSNNNNNNNNNNFIKTNKSEKLNIRL
jgi:hypothetical protein